MKTIRTKIPARTEVSYLCKTCKTHYPTAKEAVECEKRTLEKKKFKNGQEVEIKGTHSCSVAKNRGYRARGVVKNIFGPALPDRDYEISHLGGNSQRMNSHVWQYIVWWYCPHGDEQRMMFYAPELKEITE